MCLFKGPLDFRWDSGGTQSLLKALTPIFPFQAFLFTLNFLVRKKPVPLTYDPRYQSPLDFFCFLSISLPPERLRFPFPPGGTLLPTGVSFLLLKIPLICSGASFLVCLGFFLFSRMVPLPYLTFPRLLSTRLFIISPIFPERPFSFNVCFFFFCRLFFSTRSKPPLPLYVVSGFPDHPGL